jgi:hypothetical protein
LAEAWRAPRIWLYGGLLLLGLGIRLYFLPYLGTNDMTVELGWGRAVRDVGLAHAYSGIYFPIEWQLNAAAVHAGELGISTFSAIKAITLAFDIGALAMLALLLRMWGLDERYSLVYWIHPYFLLLFILGYVDAHLGFCVLACIVILTRWPRSAGFLAAGIPLALAFLMKPQAIGLVAVIPTLVLVTVVLNPSRWRENLRPLLLLVAPAVLFAAYSIYLDQGGAGLTTLAHTYSPAELTRESSGLTGRMTNFWYPVAMILRHDGAEIYTVSRPALDTVGGAAGALIITGALVAMARARPVIGAREVLFAFLFAAMTVPMVATHAHENHLYLGLLLSIVAVAKSPYARSLNWALQGLLAAQFLNIFAVYRFGINQVSTDLGPSGLQTTYLHSDVFQLIVVAATIVCWAWLMAGYVRSARGATGAHHEHLLGQGAYGQA